MSHELTGPLGRPRPRAESAEQSDPSGSVDPPPPPRGQMLSADDCRRRLAQIPGLVLLGAITPTQSNSLTKVYDLLLRDHQSRQARAAGPALSDSDLDTLKRDHPAVLHLFADLFTDDQVDRLVGKRRGSSDESP
jgi:hypothetical protein